MWTSNFRVVLRKGNLLLAMPDGNETPLKPLGPGIFQIGVEPTAERIKFDSIINGAAARIDYSGKLMYRSFTP